MQSTSPRRRGLFTSLSFLVLLALALGLGAGAAAQVNGLPGGAGTARAIEALGSLWLNALRMTIVPLVFSLLVVGIASIADAAASGRMAMKALTVFFLLLVGAIVYAFAAALGWLSVWPIDPEGGQALAVATAGRAGEVLRSVEGDGLTAFLQTLAPSNPIRAAAEDAILGVVVFAIAFGFASTRLPNRLRQPMTTFFEAVSETMIVIVHWVLLAAPLGVFALSFGVGLRTGLSAAGTLGHYISIVVLCQLGLILLVYAVAITFGRVSLARFAVAAAPVQAVAFSTQSSLASLPAMVDRARGHLGVSSATAGLVLPLAVAVFRITSPVANLAVVLYCAQLFGIPIGLEQILIGGVVAFAVSVASVGLPGQVSFFASIAPICIAMGVPVELLPLLLAVEVIPDIFRTIGNVTADLAAARIVEGGDHEAEKEAGAGI